MLGADVRHWEHGSELDITETRVDTLEEVLLEHLRSEKLSAGAAGKLYGRLSATSSQTHGKFGRAKLGPIKARQYDPHNMHLTNQLRAALLWWSQTLRNRVPRPVPLERVRRASPVITYSDGEGASAGVGVVIFGNFPGNKQPSPVFLEIPNELRMLWDLQKERSKTGIQTDIFEIEAIGPLIALLTWPQLLADRPWIHFIDNNAAQSALIKGSSNSLNGDIIAGETWNLIRKVRCWLWMDRVASKSNPIDGVSRKQWECDHTIPAEHQWSSVKRIKLPDWILQKMLQELRGSTVA